MQMRPWGIGRGMALILLALGVGLLWVGWPGHGEATTGVVGGLSGGPSQGDDPAGMAGKAISSSLDRLMPYVSSTTPFSLEGVRYVVDDQVVLGEDRSRLGSGDDVIDEEDLYIVDNDVVAGEEESGIGGPGGPDRSPCPS